MTALDGIRAWAKIFDGSLFPHMSCLEILPRHTQTLLLLLQTGKKFVLYLKKVGKSTLFGFFEFIFWWLALVCRVDTIVWLLIVSFFLSSSFLLQSICNALSFSNFPSPRLCNCEDIVLNKYSHSESCSSIVQNILYNNARHNAIIHWDGC